LKKAYFAVCFDTDTQLCFGRSTRGADGAADLLEALSHSPLLEYLDFYGCSRIPAAAWQKVRSAKWLHLKKAGFGACFNKYAKGADGAADLLEALSHSPLLEYLDFYGCSQIPAAAWQKVRSAKWLHLKKADFGASFHDPQGADGAADLLQALSQSPLLEELKFYDYSGCSQIPTAAWQKVPDGAWPKLRWAPGIPAGEEFRRLRGHGELEG